MPETTTFIPHPSIAKGEYSKIKTWVGQCKDLDEMNVKEETPLLVSVIYNQLDIAKLLLKKGASTSPVDKKGYNALHYASVNQNWQMCELLLSYKADPSFRDPKGNSTVSLLVASPCEDEKTQIKTIQAFCKGGADVNTPNDKSHTSLHLACIHSSPSVIKTIIECKGDPNIPTDSGETAIHYVARKGKEDVFKYLCKANANIIAKNKAGETALSIATQVQPHLVHAIQEATRRQIPWKQVEIKGKWPIPRCNNSTSVYNNRLFIYGGQNDFFEPSTIYQDLAFLNGETLEWQCLSSRGNAPPAICGHSSAILGSKLFLFGGCSSTKHFDDIWVLDLGIMMWSSLTASESYKISARSGHTATEISNTEFMVFGGSCEGKFFNDVHLYNSESNTWKLVTPKNMENAPEPRHHHTAELIDKNLFIFGGGNTTKFFSDVTVLNLDSWEWQKVEATGNVPSGRVGHASVVINDRLILVYGGSTETLQPLADLFAFDIETLNWIKYDSISSADRQPLRRVGHTLNTLNYHILAYGGNSMFIIHELLSEILDSQAILVTPPKPPPIQPKPQEFRQRSNTVSGTVPTVSVSCETATELQKQIRELTLLLKTQMGFSDNSEVIKKCLSIEKLTNQLPGASILPSSLAYLPESSPRTSPIIPIAKSPPTAPIKPRVLVKKPANRLRRRSLSASENVSAEAAGLTPPPKPQKPFATLRGAVPAPRETSNSEPSLVNPFKPSSPLKPSSDFGNMSAAAKKRHRSKTTAKIKETKDSLDIPSRRPEGKIRKAGTFLSMRASREDKTLPSTVLLGSTSDSSVHQTVKVEESDDKPKSPRKSTVRDIQKETPSGPVKPLRYYKKLMKQIPTRKPVNIESKDKKQKQFLEILNEFLNTEESYLRSLVVIIGLYKLPLEKEYLSLGLNHYMPLLFSNIEEIFEINLKFYSTLARCDDEIPSVSAALKLVIDDMPKYNTYCTNQSNASETVDRLIETNTGFAEFAENVKFMAESRREDLASYLTKPFQRVTRYPLLLEQLIKYAPKSGNEKSELAALKLQIDSIVAQANEDKRLIDSVVKMIEVQSSFTWQGDEGQIKFSKDCKYIFEGKFKEIDMKSQKVSRRHFFLFSEMLVIAKPVGKKYKKQSIIYLDGCLVWNNIDSNTPDLYKHAKHAFTVASTCDSTRLVMGASSDIEKDHWMKLISSAIKKFCVPDYRKVRTGK